jgi:hypothetical protein
MDTNPTTDRNRVSGIPAAAHRDVPVVAWRCNAAPNQQFELSGQTIFALGGLKCLDVANGL